MAGGYPRPTGDDLWQQLAGFFAEVKRQLRELQTSTGTQITDLVAQVKAKLAELDATVNALVAAALGNYYTIAQTDSRILNPGNIFPGHVSASGEVVAAGKVRGGNIWGNILAVDYRVVYVSNPTGELGHVPSSRRFKTCIQPAHLDLDAVLGLDLVSFKYKQAAEAYGSVEAAPTVLGLIAEDVAEAGLGYLVYEGEDGEIDGVAYERLGLPLLALAQAQEKRIAALEAAVAKLTS